MKLVFTSYINSPEFSEPCVWLKRIEGYTGILESLAAHHTVIGIERINYEGECRQNEVLYYFIKLKRKIVRFPRLMHKIIKQLQPDVVFVNGLGFPLQVIQLRIALGNKIKIIAIHHAEKPFTGLKKILQQQADRRIDNYFFTSKEMGMEWVQRGIIAKEKKITEVMEASSFFTVMDKEKAIAQTGATGDPIFLWVGRLDANKDPLTAVKAFEAFIKHQPAAKLYMIYHTEELMPQVISLLEKSSQLKQAVKLVGKVPHTAMQYWYNSADFIISASHYEGSGVAVCEAMSCGCIPILTRIPSFLKMTGQGKCGLLYERGEDEALLKALLQTLQLNKEAERTKVLKQFKEELSFEAIAETYGSVVKTLLPH